MPDLSPLWELVQGEDHVIPQLRIYLGIRSEFSRARIGPK